MANRTTALVGKLKIDGKEARAELDAVVKKFADYERAQKRVVALNLKPGFVGPNSALGTQKYPQAATAAESYLRTQRSVVQVTNQVATANQAAGRSSQKAAMGVLELSRAFEDAQYGMRGVLNNIPGIIQSFGGGAGLAGVISIAAVALSQLIDMDKIGEQLTGPDRSKGRMRLFNERTDTSRERAFNARLEEARQQAEGGAGLSKDVDDAENRRRAREEATLSRRMKAIDAEAQLAAAKKMTGTESSREADIVKMEAWAAQEKVNLEIRLYQERLHNNEAADKAMHKRLTDLQREERQIRANEAANGGLSRPEKERMAALPDLIAAAAAADEAAKARRESDTAGLDDAKYRKSSIPADFAAAAVKAKAEAAKRARTSLYQTVGTAFESIGDFFDKAGQKMREIGDKVRAQQASRESGETDLSVSEIRNPRTRRRAQRALSLVRRTREIMASDGVSENEAAGRAAREQRVTDRANGDRTIRGAGPARQFEGLDAYDRYRDKSVPKKVESADEKAGGAALQKAKEDLGKSGGLNTAVQTTGLLQSILDEIRNQGSTPAEKNKPLRSN